MEIDFENEMIKALKKHAEGKIAMAKATAQVYMNNPVGIGEHPQVMEELEKQMMTRRQTHSFAKRTERTRTQNFDSDYFGEDDDNENDNETNDDDNEDEK